MSGVSGVMSIADGGGRWSRSEALRAAGAGRAVRRRGIDAGARAVPRPSRSIFPVRATVAARCITV